MAIVKDCDPATYIQARKRYCPRYFNGHRGFNTPIEIVDISKLTRIPRENIDYIQHQLINPIVICKMTPERWKGDKVGNIPFRDPSCITKVCEDGYMYVVSRGNKRLASLIELGYKYIDAYICSELEQCFDLGKRIEEEYYESQ
jgi:hypothetical protein